MWLLTRDKRKQKDRIHAQKKKRSEVVFVIILLFWDNTASETLTNASFCSNLQMRWVWILICCSGQFVVDPSLEDNPAPRVIDLLIGYHSEAWTHGVLNMESEKKPMYCILKFWNIKIPDIHNRANISSKLVHTRIISNTM